MTDRERDSPTVLPLKDGRGNANDELPYTIVLCVKDAPERVLARAVNAQLAHASYAAATKEYPQERLVMRKSGNTIFGGGAT